MTWRPSPRRRWPGSFDVAADTDTIIDLLRHGETEAGARYIGSSDVRLTPIGWRQMDTALAEHGPWDILVSSPLRRCADFAGTHAARHALHLRIEDDFREMHFGAWEGRSAAELMVTDAEALQRFWSDPTVHTPPQAEPWSIFQARVLTAWEAMLACHTHRRVLLIAHGGVIRTILCHLQKRPHVDLLRIDVPVGSRHRVSLDADRACSHVDVLDTVTPQ